MRLCDIEISLKAHFRKDNHVAITIYTYMFILISLFLSVALNHMNNYYNAHKDQIYVYNSKGEYNFDNIKGIKKAIDKNEYKIKLHTPSFSSKYDGFIYLMSQDNYKISHGRDIINDDEIVCPDLFAPDSQISILNINFKKKLLYRDFYHRNFNIDKNLTVYVVGTYDSFDKLNDSNVCYASDKLLTSMVQKEYTYNKGYYLILNSKKDRKRVINEVKKQGYDVKFYLDKNVKYEILGTIIIFIIWLDSLVVLLVSLFKSLREYRRYVTEDNFIDENYLGIELFNHQLSQLILYLLMISIAYLGFYYMEYIYVNLIFLDLEYLNIEVPFNWLGYISAFLVVTIYSMISMNIFNIFYYLRCKIRRTRKK